MNLKKCLGLLVAIFMLSNSLYVEAEEREIITTGEITITSEQMTKEMLEQCEHIFLTNSEDGLSVGEERIFYQDNEYILYVELLNVQENSNARSVAKEISHTYSFTETNIWGIKENVFDVVITCYWTENGTNSKIDKLNGSYTNYKTSKYTLSWTDSSYSEVSCALYLKWVVNYVDEYNACFAAYLHKIGNYATSPYVELVCF